MIERADRVEGSIPAEGGAIYSQSGIYRYRLDRYFTDQLFGPVDLWVMLNPSTATAEQNDPTVRRCMGFSHQWGAAGLYVANLFAYRSTDPVQLAHTPDPVGPDNLSIIRNLAANVDRVICAWGASIPRAHEDWPRTVARALLTETDEVYTLGTTAAGHPRHPLYVRGDTPLEKWRGYT